MLVSCAAGMVSVSIPRIGIFRFGRLCGSILLLPRFPDTMTMTVFNAQIAVFLHFAHSLGASSSGAMSITTFAGTASLGSFNPVHPFASEGKR